MGGHSHWKGIKEKKGAADAKRGKLFAKLLRAIEVSARQGDPNPENNPTLFDAIQRAKDASMPKDNIERAINARPVILQGSIGSASSTRGTARAVSPCCATRSPIIETGRHRISARSSASTMETWPSRA